MTKGEGVQKSGHVADTICKWSPKTDDSGIFTALLQNACGSTKSSTNLNVISENNSEYAVSSEASQKTTTTTSTRSSRGASESAISFFESIRI